MEEFPDYKFSFEGAVKYAWFKKYIAEGRWYPSGGWDANDWRQNFNKREFTCILQNTLIRLFSTRFP